MEDFVSTEAERAIWMSMADHFLDTETRPGIVHTALLCVDAGLSTEDAHAIWLSEVSPVVGINLLSVAGEWAGWDEDWLVERVAKRAQRRRQRQYHKLSRWLEGLRVDLNAAVWKSIERCMLVLGEAPLDLRGEMAADLSLLADHYYFHREQIPALAAEHRARLQNLREILFSVLAPATLREELAPAHTSITRLLRS